MTPNFVIVVNLLLPLFSRKRGKNKLCPTQARLTDRLNDLFMEIEKQDYF